MTLRELHHLIAAFPDTPRMPALFVGHGSPMNAIEENDFTKGWQAIARKIPAPSAILAISAHWFREGTLVHMAERPKTIHDFWGFPKELYDIRYDCPGSPSYARATQAMLTHASVGADLDWGIDHGTWSVLRRMYPEADIPTFQMSIDATKPSSFHYELGRALAPLRTKGALIIGSGNLVHNLGNIAWEENAKPFDWALEFDARATQLIEAGDHRSLIEYEKLGHAALLAVPTPDHYWPLLYILGLQKKDETLTFPIEGITHGSISMRAALIGA